MGKEKKICSLGELAEELNGLRQQNLRIVQCHGVFDLLHVGHIRHFEKAKQLGDVLVVTLTPDRFVNKGINRPAFPEKLRAETLASLSCVDYVAINEWPTAVNTINLLRPNIYAKGSDYKKGQDTTGNIQFEEEAVRQVGGVISYTEDITFSSSALINQFLSPYSEEVRGFLGDFCRRYSAEDILAPLKAAHNLKVLVVGEAIIDEYHYCEAIGKAGKEPVLATLYQSTERFAGGVLACANHLAGFCKQVDVLTCLGQEKDQEEFVRTKLKANVNLNFFFKANSPTILKARFLDKYLSHKMFEIYYMNDAPLTEQEEAHFRETLHQSVPDYDVVIVADYGHGLLSPQTVSDLCNQASFLAVNTQSNAGNHGFNLISKYPRADYVCLALREFALETRNQRLTPENMILHVAEKLSCPRLLLTQGKYGSYGYATSEGCYRVPALATQVVDRIGAGDAVLCITALAASQGMAPEPLAFLGNVVGAEAVSFLGNQCSIERVSLFRHVECLMKMHDQEKEKTGFKHAA